MKLELKDYILNKIKIANQQFNFPKSKVDRAIRGNQENKFKFETNEKFHGYGSINCNDDVTACVNVIPVKIQQYLHMVNKGTKLYPVDFFDIDLTLSNCIVALEKMANNLENSYCDFKYSQKDIDAIFAQIEIYRQQLESLLMKNACQD